MSFSEKDPQSQNLPPYSYEDRETGSPIIDIRNLPFLLLESLESLKIHEKTSPEWKNLKMSARDLLCLNMFDSEENYTASEALKEDNRWIMQVPDLWKDFVESIEENSSK